MIKYPARFKPDKINNQDGYFLQFLDIPNAFTQGYSIDELYDMGQDVLSLILEDYIEENKEIPMPSEVKGDDILYIEPYSKVALPIVVKILRKLNNLSQKDIAEKLGVSYQTYQKLERGQTVNPTLTTLQRIAKAFGMKMEINFKCKDNGSINEKNIKHIPRAICS
jgi:antitoxin HicB